MRREMMIGAEEAAKGEPASKSELLSEGSSQVPHLEFFPPSIKKG